MIISKFNYIITIHNKEELIERVVMSVLMCCHSNSYIYTVLDGCTDRTEEIIDSIIKKFPEAPITKVYTPDVHEILSINAGLRAADQQGIGYNIILQDDVILTDFTLEEKVTKLYEWAGSSLGFVSFRLGANFAKDAAKSNEISPFSDYVENAYGHGLPYANVLLPGQFAYRTVPTKSPVCIPFALIRSVGMLEEQLAPYMCDDIEYAIRCTKAGYRNGVFGIRFQSDVEWGTTRVKPDSQMSKIHRINIEKIRKWHYQEINKIAQSNQHNEIINVPGIFCESHHQQALENWDYNRQRLESINTKNNRKTINVIKSVVKQLLNK